jgi:CBS-domain-containing membrane protein
MTEDSRLAELDSLEPGNTARRRLRRRLTLKGEFTLAILPTLTVLLVLGLIQALTEQRLLFASLASSAFLIYLDPEHGTNSVRTLTIAHLAAATIGLVTYSLLGDGYLSGGIAMVATITLMIFADAVHPPAVATAMAFALRSGDASNIFIFGIAVIASGALIVLERALLWMLARNEAKEPIIGSRSSQ